MAELTAAQKKERQFGLALGLCCGLFYGIAVGIAIGEKMQYRKQELNELRSRLWKLEAPKVSPMEHPLPVVIVDTHIPQEERKVV